MPFLNFHKAFTDLIRANVSYLIPINKTNRPGKQCFRVEQKGEMNGKDSKHPPPDT